MRVRITIIAIKFKHYTSNAMFSVMSTTLLYSFHFTTTSTPSPGHGTHRHEVLDGRETWCNRLHDATISLSVLFQEILISGLFL